MSKKPRVVLLHGTPVAVEPIQRAFATRWPGAEAVDESRRLLAEDLNIVSWLTPGSRGFIDAVGAFRHRLFAHLGLLQKARR